MAKLRTETREVAAATRGQIVQRVLVDGWSTAQAAAATGLNERQIARWVRDYRRHGMASLRRATGEPAWRRGALVLRHAVLHWFGGLGRGLGRKEAAICVVLRHEDESRRRR